MVGGIGLALHEETLTDPRSGRIVGPNLAEYLVPTHADVPQMEIVMVNEADDYLPEGVKGVGMLGHVGSSAAVNRRPTGTPYRRVKGTLVEQRHSDRGRTVRAGCGVGRA